MLWGGREGYETLLNTDLKRELDQLGRFLTLVVEHKHKIGFKGTILIEPKPQEPTKHQYDYDVATVYGFLQALTAWRRRSRSTSSRTTPSSPATPSSTSSRSPARSASSARSTSTAATTSRAGTPTSSPTTCRRWRWPTTRSCKAGGFTTGGFNFDAKLRRQSLDPATCCIGHIGGMDCCARGLKAAAAHGRGQGAVGDRWPTAMPAGTAAEAKAMLAGKRTLEEIAERVVKEKIKPQPRSGRQEWLENIVNRYV